MHRSVNRRRTVRILLAAALALLWQAAHPPGSNAASTQAGKAIVDAVEGYRLERLVRALSGADSIISGAERTRIETRYALSARMDVVRNYLKDEIRSAGYEPSIQRFVLNVAVPDLTGAAVSDDGDTVWIADTDGRIHRGLDEGGLTRFARCGTVGHLVFDLERDPRGRLWAACRLTGTAYGALFVSTDGGANWQERASGTDIYTVGSVGLSSGRYGMAAGSNGTVLRTIDFGDSWWPLDPATFGYEAFNGIAVIDSMRYRLITDSGYLYETPDFGMTWSRRSLMFGRLSGIAFFGDSAGVIVGSGRAFYTKDAGATWISVSVATEFTAVRMWDSLRVIAAGTGGEIWRSGDGGATWERFGTECSVSQDVWSIASAGDAHWLAGRDLARRVIWSETIEDCAAIAFSDTIWGENISFRREGEREPDRRMLLTAHYDSKSGTPYDCAPGADDNASGVAAVVECARILRDARLEGSVEFVLFDGEELGLLGSRFYAGALDSDAVYDGVFNLDMIGYEPNEEMSAAIGARAGATPDTILVDALAAAIEAFDLPLSTALLPAGDPGTSDHAAFWSLDTIPSVLLIEGKSGERTPYYHSCADQANTLNYEFLEVCTKAALGTVALVAGLVPEAPLQFALAQNYPNPFNAGTIVSYTLEETADVNLAVYDVAGRRVALIERSTRGPGSYERGWNGRDENGRRLASGVYFLRLKAGSAEAVRKMVILQ